MIIIVGEKMEEREFKKLSDDSMFKAFFSDKRYMNWLLERFLGRKVDNIYNFMMDQESCEKLQRAILKTAKEEAHEQGYNEGMGQGIEQNKIDTAFKMLSKNYPISEISDMTGYSQEYLQSMRI